MIHLSELSHRSTQNPNEVVKLWQIVKAKIILLDPKNRKIGLSMKWLNEDIEAAVADKPAKKSAKKWLEDIVKKLAEEDVVEEKTEEKVEKKAPAKKAPAKKTTKKEEKSEE